MTTESNFQIPSGYERGIRFGANWTRIISPYMILYFILRHNLPQHKRLGRSLFWLFFLGRWMKSLTGGQIISLPVTEGVAS